VRIVGPRGTAPSDAVGTDGPVARTDADPCLVGGVATRTHINPGRLRRDVPTVYYVTVNGNRVAGPYESRKEAKREADTRSTNEVNLTYDVESVRE
jgi:hypothetical protein